VNADIGALLVDATGSSSLVALLAIGGGGGLSGVELLVRVVDEIFLVRHVDGCDAVDEICSRAEAGCGQLKEGCAGVVVRNPCGCGRVLLGERRGEICKRKCRKVVREGLSQRC